MRNNFQKTVVFGAIVALIVFFGVKHASLFFFGDASTADAGSLANGAAGAASHRPPLLVLPSLSANIGANNPVVPPATPKPTTPAPKTPSSTNTTPTPKITPAPNVDAAAVLVADLQTGVPFLNENADERWPLASVSKLMTAVVATDLLGLDQHITITESMVAVDPTEPVLRVGDTYTVSDLLRVMLLPSNNVAAEALAEFAGRDRFLAAMNAKAAAWGMTTTYYDDPSGLSAANQSSANDLLKLAQHIYDNYQPVLAITRMPQATVQNLSTNQSVTVNSINNFAGNADFIGGKTGYTDQADGNLLSIFQYNGRVVFVVVLGINDGVRFNATQQLYNWFKVNFK